MNVSFKQARQICIHMIKKNPHVAIMLWGKPGEGKSALAKEIASIFKKKLIDIRLSQFDPVDLRGLPVPNLEEKFVEWLIPNFLPTNSDAMIILDEISSAPKLVQAAAYQLVLDRELGDYKLPDGVTIIAASNPEGQGICFEMPKPLISRFDTHLNVELEAKEWRDWAYKTQQDERVIAFIGQFPQHMRTDSGDDECIAYACGRSLANLSSMIKNDKIEPFMREAVIGCVGTVVGNLFLGFDKYRADMPDVNAILNKGDYKYPEKPEILHQVIAAIIAKLIAEKSSSKKSIMVNNSLGYSAEMPDNLTEFGVVLAMDLASNVPDFSEFVIDDNSNTTSQFDAFQNRYEQYLI